MSGVFVYFLRSWACAQIAFPPSYKYLIFNTPFIFWDLQEAILVNDACYSVLDVSALYSKNCSRAKNRSNYSRDPHMWPSISVLLSSYIIRNPMDSFLLKIAQSKTQIAPSDTIIGTCEYFLSCLGHKWYAKSYLWKIYGFLSVKNAWLNRILMLNRIWESISLPLLTQREEYHS